MADQTLDFGKHKGKPLSDVPEAYLEWVILNVGRKDAVQAAESELARRGRDIIVGGKKSAKAPNQLFDTDKPERPIPSGKHKGKRLSQLDDRAVHGMWSAWNGINKLKVTAFFKEIEAEVARRKIKPGKKSGSSKATKTKGMQKSEDQHYVWTDRNGTEHLIPNDVSMEGRENEEAPF